MEKYLRFLASKASDVNNIPSRIQGRVMEKMSDICANVFWAKRPDGTDLLMYAGRDVHSCTSSVAALVFWLCPPKTPLEARYLSELAVEHQHAVIPMTYLTSDATVGSLVELSGQSSATMLIFSTTHHKFSVLCVGKESVLLQSNQDDTCGGERFTLHEWIHKCSRNHNFITPAHLSKMIRDIASAAIGLVDHEAVFDMYFGGARFRRGNPEDYWVLPLHVTLPMDLFE